jgi:hypothetical protein
VLDVISPLMKCHCQVDPEMHVYLCVFNACVGNREEKIQEICENMNIPNVVGAKSVCFIYTKSVSMSKENDLRR